MANDGISGVRTWNYLLKASNHGCVSISSSVEECNYTELSNICITNTSFVYAAVTRCVRVMSDWVTEFV